MTDKTLTTSLSAELAEQFQIAPTKAEQIMGAFTDTAKLIGELDKEYKEFAKIKEITKEISDSAKTLRLKYVKARTGANNKRKEIKAQVLLESKTIDGAGNIFKLQISERENPLMEIEKHFERIEEEKRQVLKLERIELLKKLELETFDHLYLDQMTPEIWESFYAGEKAKFEAEQKAIKEADKKAKADKEFQKLTRNRKDIILERGVGAFIENEVFTEIGGIEDNEFSQVLASAEKAKDDKAAEDERIRKENAKLAKEKEEADKKLEEANRKAAKAKEEADDELAEARIKILEARKLAEELSQAEADKKDKEDAETAQKEADLKKKQEEEEEAKKNKKYIDWLDSNGLILSMVGKSINDGFTHWVEKSGDTFHLCQKVDSLII